MNLEPFDLAGLCVLIVITRHHARRCTHDFTDRSGREFAPRFVNQQSPRAAGSNVNAK